MQFKPISRFDNNNLKVDVGCSCVDNFFDRVQMQGRMQDEGLQVSQGRTLLHISLWVSS